MGVPGLRWEVGGGVGVAWRDLLLGGWVGEEEEEEWEGFAEVGEHGEWLGGWRESGCTGWSFFYILGLEVGVVRAEWKAGRYAGRSLGWVLLRMCMPGDMLGCSLDMHGCVVSW